MNTALIIAAVIYGALLAVAGALWASGGPWKNHGRTVVLLLTTLGLGVVLARLLAPERRLMVGHRPPLVPYLDYDTRQRRVRIEEELETIDDETHHPVDVADPDAGADFAAALYRARTDGADEPALPDGPEPGASVR